MVLEELRFLKYSIQCTYAKVGLAAGSRHSIDRVRASMSPVKNCNIEHGLSARVKVSRNPTTPTNITDYIQSTTSQR
jgi:hypothetical protein